MKLFRHPIRSIREPFGTAGLIIACVALIAALGGSAYAAKGALTGKQKKEVTKIAQKYAGKSGAAGATGPPGPAGLAGPAGPKGDKGDRGEKGEAGSPGSPGGPGADGKSVGAVPIAQGETACDEQGGAFYEIEESTEPPIEICNGTEGSPWVAGGLPPGQTEMGTWSMGVLTAATGTAYVPVSFTVPLAAGTTVEVHFVNTLEEEEKESTGRGHASICTGSKANPTAPPGVMCVYEQQASVGGEPVGLTTHFENAFSPMSSGAFKAGRVGTNLVFNGPVGGFARGDWAVTAPTP